MKFPKETMVYRVKEGGAFHLLPVENSIKYHIMPNFKITLQSGKKLR